MRNSSEGLPSIVCHHLICCLLPHHNSIPADFYSNRHTAIRYGTRNNSSSTFIHPLCTLLLLIFFYTSLDKKSKMDGDESKAMSI